LILGGKNIVNEILSWFSGFFINAHHFVFEWGNVLASIDHAALKIISLLSVPFVCVMASAVISNLMQTGGVLSFHVLKVDLNRINPVVGFKKIFSKKSLVDLARTSLRFLILASVLYWALSSSIPVLLRGLSMNGKMLPTVLAGVSVGIAWKMILALFMTIILDWWYSRWEFAQRMRMSKREIKEEVKRREGDPRIKSRIRELQREALNRAAALSKVKQSDVLVVNPTHFAVGIKYDEKVVDAPVLIAKGAGAMALEMKRIARLNRIPVMQNKTLARELFFNVKIDGVIPDSYYSALAKIYSWVYSLKGIKA